MIVDGWRYSNHTAVPVSGPHEPVDLRPIKSGAIWKLDGGPILARWITEWDCGKETNWWYVIKDKPFDLGALKSKRRYEINKGNKYYTVRKIRPEDYGDELFQVTVRAYEGWPQKYRPVVDKDRFINSLPKWNNSIVYGAFFVEDNGLCGYGIVSDEGTWMSFSVLRTIPEHERNGINAALVYGILIDNEHNLSQGKYISDGARSVFHETSFQDYLEKYFEFRKAYCKLNVKYKKSAGFLINMIYPFRSLLLKLDNIGVVHSINAVLKLESIHRSEI